MSQPLIVLAALLDGHEEAARGAIAALGEPFARIPGTHQARLQVLRAPARRWRGRPRPYLLAAAEHDGAVEPWLAVFARELDGVMAHCAFWPGPANPAEVVRWARERELHAGFQVLATDATVEEVGHALATHGEARRLVMERSAR